ncbi:MAG: hypothetical protein ABI678_29720 [Kofleriaceae bacterium]
MRIWPSALAVSVLAHTVALAWVGQHKLEPLPVVTLAPPPEVTITTVEPEPLAVALLDDHTVAMAPQSPVPELKPSSRGNRISTGHATGATPHEVGPSTEPAKPHAGLMTMRKPEPPVLKGPSAEFWRKFEENTKPLQPNPIEGEQIQNDVASAGDNLRNPRWIANHSPEEVTDERMRLIAAEDARDGHELKQKGAGYEADHATFKGEVEPDGTIHIHEKRRYDPTEILMNEVGIDPYASNKLRTLDRTRDERYELGKRYKKQQLGKSVVIAQKNLDYLWAKTTTLAERKEALFEMWDECAERGDDDLVTAGAAVRELIIGFIRGRMTGAAAFTPSELAAFNAKKKSAATFAPYGD